MNRRDLILGSTLGIAAAGASAQAQTKAGGVSIPSYYGQVAEIAFTTSADLQAFMPPGLTVVDPHKAFIKAERVKIRSPEADKLHAAFSHYDQVCVTVMATTPQFGPRQRNILMWTNRGWAIPGSEMGVKRYANIHMPNIFDIDYAIAEQGGLVPFYVNIFASMTPYNVDIFAGMPQVMGPILASTPAASPARICWRWTSPPPSFPCRWVEQERSPSANWRTE
jgi:hypothetical protein